MSPHSIKDTLRPSGSTLPPAKRPFTIDDLLALERNADPQLSPDGKLVACCLGLKPVTLFYTLPKLFFYRALHTTHNAKLINASVAILFRIRSFLFFDQS